MRIILASGSPRRRELLSEIGLEFEIHKPDADEAHSDNENPEELCRRLSRLKALAVANDFSDSLIIAADTIVVIDGKILGKPHDRNDACKMLRMLAGREHEVLTGVSVCLGKKIITHSESTKVKFRNLTDSEILAYVSTGECDDKAGAYAVQGKGSLLIESLNGDYYNVVGLPLCALGKILENFGIKIENMFSL